jgi:hypothetical protein
MAVAPPFANLLLNEKTPYKKIKVPPLPVHRGRPISRISMGGRAKPPETYRTSPRRKRDEKILRPVGRRTARLKASSIHIIEDLMLTEICEARKELYPCRFRHHAPGGVLESPKYP